MPHDTKMPSYSLKKAFRLNTGADMPAVGLGTYQSTHEVAVEGLCPSILTPPNYAYHRVDLWLVTAVKKAAEFGYRHIDTAWSYGSVVSFWLHLSIPY